MLAASGWEVSPRSCISESSPRRTCWRLMSSLRLISRVAVGLDGFFVSADGVNWNGRTKPRIDELNARLEHRRAELERERECMIGDIQHIARAWVLPHPERQTPTSFGNNTFTNLNGNFARCLSKLFDHYEVDKGYDIPWEVTGHAQPDRQRTGWQGEPLAR